MRFKMREHSDIRLISSDAGVAFVGGVIVKRERMLQVALGLLGLLNM